MDAAQILDALAGEPKHRAVRLALAPGVALWIRLRRPTAGGGILLDVAMSAINAALTSQQAAKEADKASLEGDAHQALRAAANAARVDVLESAIDRHLIETVCGTASPSGDGPDPDPEVDADWIPYVLTDRRSKVAPGSAHVRDLPPAVRRELYGVVRAWLVDPGAEVGRDVAAFRDGQRAGAAVAGSAGAAVPHRSGDGRDVGA